MRLNAHRCQGDLIDRRSFHMMERLIPLNMYYIQIMLPYNQNDALMYKQFPSSLEPTTLRWFNGLRKGSIHNFGELIQEFGARFMTCIWVAQSVDVLLSMKMGARETLRSYGNRYWELYNEIGGGN